MPILQPIPIPFSSNGPPPEFAYGERSISQLSTTPPLHERVEERDSWGGKPRCVVCGREKVLRFCYIISPDDYDTCEDLQEKNFIPKAANVIEPRLEPRNVMLMCPDHRNAFNKYSFFIRFVPQERKFVFVNFSRSPDNAHYHGKAVNLSIDDKRVPFPALFLIHERRVRSCWPFSSEPEDIPMTIQFQDWMMTDSVV